MSIHGTEGAYTHAQDLISEERVLVTSYSKLRTRLVEGWEWRRDGSHRLQFRPPKSLMPLGAGPIIGPCACEQKTGLRIADADPSSAPPLHSLPQAHVITGALTASTTPPIRLCATRAATKRPHASTPQRNTSKTQAWATDTCRCAGRTRTMWHAASRIGGQRSIVDPGSMSLDQVHADAFRARWRPISRLILRIA